MSYDPRYSDDDVVEARGNRRSRRLESFQLTPNNDEEEEDGEVLSPRLNPQQRMRRRSLLLTSVVLSIALVTTYAVATRIGLYSKDSQPETNAEPFDFTSSESLDATIAPDTSSSEQIDPVHTTANIDCPLASTKSSDSKFLSEEEWSSAGCHRMECLSETPLRNTRDRLGHNAPLCRGQALCNGDDEKFPGVLFQFGLTASGALVWQKCNPSDPSQTEIVTLRAESQGNFTNTSFVMPPRNESWFQMTSDATWQILSMVDQNDDSIATTPTVVWEQSVENQPRPVGVTPKCLSANPVLDCPYIHFRRHGDIVMNYIDAQDGWIACKSRKICYSSLWERI